MCAFPNRPLPGTALASIAMGFLTLERRKVAYRAD